MIKKRLSKKIFMKSINNFLNESIENEVYLSESILDADKPVSLRTAKKRNT